MKKLTAYRKKRHLRTSNEPPARVAKKHAVLNFVVQKHAASHLHYDFRLEVNGVLKSWAIPKGPSLNPSEKRLAIMVEDHPFEYRNFEGIIPKGHYGAGTVMVWDAGVYIPVDEHYATSDATTAEHDIETGHLTFVLDGQKLHGAFKLVKLKKSDPNDKNWLLIKIKDDFASTKDLTKQDISVLSQRSMNQISHGEDPKDPPQKIKRSNKKAVRKVKKRTSVEMPRDITPMLAYLADEPFDSPDWLFEIKWDGFRAIAEIEDQKIRLYSRSLQSFNLRFPSIVKALQDLHIEAVIDGEIVILDKAGRPDFQALQNYQREPTGELRYYVFDLLYYKGEDLRERPLIERKALLEKLIPTNKQSLILFSEHILAKGKKFFTSAEKHKLEGIMAKECASTYSSKRSRSWLKLKTHGRQEAIICGYTAPKGSRKGFGALILGIYEGKKLKYIGHVGGGFDQKSLLSMMKHMRPLISTKCPFDIPPATNTPVTWIKPKLMCEVSFAEWTKEGIMRQPIFMGLRSDKNIQEVKMEKAIPVTSEQNVLTHLDKVFWPKEGYTKGDLLEYYGEVADYILPYLKNRPESLRRYPNGIEQQGFFQKNVGHTLPDWLPTIEVQHEGKIVNYLMIQDRDSLLFAVNFGCIDLNPFSSRIPHLDKPDYLILDLDPENIAFEYVIETALVIHDVLEEANIPNYCKTSGARGMHILVPLGAKYTFEQAKQFAQLVAEISHERLPTITSLERKPAARQKKVYIDYLQNHFGQTIAAPYSVRPKPGATVSTPLEWSEVKKGLDPHDFTIATMNKRLNKKGDIFLPVLKKGIDLKKSLKKLQAS